MKKTHTKHPKLEIIQPQLELRELHWPEQKFYPLNHHDIRDYAAKVVENDIGNTTNFLIATGFTSLAYIIDSFHTLDANKKIRIVLGFEPDIYRRKRWKQVQIEQEIADYWLDRGISPVKSGAVLRIINLIQLGQLQFKVLKNLHAKLYISDSSAMLGSSNFSKSGLKKQHEANVRFEEDAYIYNTFPYEEIKSIAENFWDYGTDYNDGMIKLLEELVIIVDWKEALARAIAAVLEGHYLKEYTILQEKVLMTRLWPSQWSGIALGMQILQQKGSLLIADPTGSGKTRMVCMLQLALIQWLYAIGKMDKTNGAIVAPPVILDAWIKEQIELERMTHNPISQGILSYKESDKHKTAIKLLQAAHLLVMDEAHNYLNKTSNRSGILYKHNAEHIILSTATPINKKAKDLIRLIELLGPDNLGNDELSEFKDLYKRKLNEVDTPGLEKLRSFIWKFTLRRTKTQLNSLIDQSPDSYRNITGARCRYPQQDYKNYSTGETEEDVAIANKILEEAKNLKGIIYLQTIRKPKQENLKTIEAEAAYIKKRIDAAAGLAKYRVSATLRSSRPALIELIEGTRAATSFVNIPELKKKTGNTIKKLDKHKLKLPKFWFNLSALPDWLQNEVLYKQACEAEINSYKKIASLVREMGDSREVQKVSQLIKYLQDHKLVIAFDHTVITLHYFAYLLNQRGIQYYIATGGEDKAGVKIVQQIFSLGTKATNIVALCSDAMSEGVNLQGADALVMLDMPSILRLAEQRIGRIDRLDSQHQKIVSYWPNDTEAFALRTDRNLYKTTELTKRMLHANMTLPQNLLERFAYEKIIKLDEIIEDLKERQHESEERIGDVFKEVYRLKEGEDALISAEDYKNLSQSRARVRCKVSYVGSNKNWAFFAMAGSKTEAPRWIFIDEDGNHVQEYDAVCKCLRNHLVNVETVAASESEHEYFLNILRRKEREILPNKKRRALRIAEQLLKKQQVEAIKHRYIAMNEVIKELLKAFSYTQEDETSIDWYQFADTWLELLTPVLKSLQEQNITKRIYYSLDDLTIPKYSPSFTLPTLQSVLDNIPLIKPIENRIAANIIGIKQEVV